jgi:hypothetical protein
MATKVVRSLAVGALITCGCASQVAGPPGVAAGSRPTAATVSLAKPPPVPPAAVPAAALPAARQLAQEETITLASGSTLTVAKGWFVSEDNDLLVLQDPDRQVRLGNVELAAADREAAVTAGWARFQPGFALKVARTVEMPARDGWDAASIIMYVIPANENRRVQAIARRQGTTWYVWFVDGNKAALDRRRAQAMLPFTSFKPVGLQKESFAGRVAHPFDAAKQQLLSAFIEQARKDAEVPGLAIGVVQGGKLVWEQAFGVKVDVGEWQSPAVQKVERDGSERLLTTAPARRLEFVVGPRTLTLKMPQQEYVFTVAGASASRR